MACLQTKGGTEAAGLTAQEADARFNAARDAARAAYKEHPESFGCKLRFSWDGASAHKAAEKDLPLLPGQLLKPPAHSPDLQRAIEIPHNLIHQEFAKRLADDGRVNTVKAALELLLRVVPDVITKKKVRKLVEGLPDTYRSIIKNKGDWADKRHR
jgi:hypothetical protein